MKNCKYCNQEFKIKKRKTQSFCCIACANKYKGKENEKQRIRYCLHCKQEFILKNIAYEKRGGGKYCSMDCSKFATKKYTTNEAYFDVIDSEEKAYWLGFIFADGFNSNNDLRVMLSKKDETHLYKLQQALSTDQPIRDIIGRPNPTIELRAGGRKLCEALTKIGCIKNKSLVVKYPNIESKYNKHFIRGIFDGDGCCHVNKNGYKCWSIFSRSIDFITDIKNIIELEVNITLNLYQNTTISTSKKANIIKLTEYFYSEASVWLERKYLKMIK